MYKRQLYVNIKQPYVFRLQRRLLKLQSRCLLLVSSVYPYHYISIKNYLSLGIFLTIMCVAYSVISRQVQIKESYSYIVSINLIYRIKHLLKIDQTIVVWTRNLRLKLYCSLKPKYKNTKKIIIRMCNK